MAELLIVEDGELSLFSLVHYFRAQGHTVRGAPTGAYALRLAEERAPDLVILDLKLPDISGYAICRELKSGPATHRSAIVMHTGAYLELSDRVEGLLAGADEFLAKPISLARLGAIVTALLKGTWTLHHPLDLAVILEHQGRVEEAVTRYSAVLRSRPDRYVARECRRGLDRLGVPCGDTWAMPPIPVGGTRISRQKDRAAQA